MIKRLSTAAVLAVGASFLLAPSSAQADPANHCWTDVESGASACFSTFAEVVEDLSGGSFVVRGGPATFSESDARSLAAVASSVPAATVYEDASYGGSSNTYVVAGACGTDTTVDYQVNISGTAWDDRITSFKSFNSCETKLWTGVYAGSSVGFVGNLANVGSTLNDAGSSLQWR
jgi:hypothetical protein